MSSATTLPDNTAAGAKPNEKRSEMATVPGQLIWEIVKRNNSFLVKEFGNGSQSVQFSKEPNNLYNLNSYKHSGQYGNVSCLCEYV
ncbi:60S ribosomal protein L28-2-like protein [Tanacetum coccineum]